MAQTIICSVCGGETDAGKKFCKLCGSPIEVTVAAVTASAALAPEVSVATCPHCGAALKKPDQKFCGSCGGVIEKAQAGSADTSVTAPVAVADGTAATASIASSKDAMKDGLAKASAKLDDFMGASLDLDAVGKDFDAGSISLASLDDEGLAEAFAFFGKSLNESAAAEGTDVTDVAGSPDQRRDSETVEEKAPRSKEARDFSAKAGTAVIGALSSQLHAEFAPKVEMIAEHRGKAATKEHKDRLKHKVALGDMDKRGAVELAEE
ncbi:MAG: zinc ribbon domain-containing protein [Coriobacteriales bacterium]